MNIPKLIFSIVAIAFGVFIFIYGGYDDSPGAQLLGALIVISGIFGAITSKKKKNN